MRRSEYTRTQKRRRLRGARLYATIAVGAIVAIVALAIVVDSAVYYNKIRAGVSIAGTDMAGKTRDEATARLSALVETAHQNPIALSSEAQTWELYASDVRTTVDVEGAVTAAMQVAREGNFFSNLGKRLEVHFNGVDIPLTGSVDGTLLSAYLENIAAELDIPPVNAGLAFEGGRVIIVEGRNGIVVDKDALRAELEALLTTLHSTEVVIPMITQQPAVQAEDMQPAVEKADTMMSAPVRLVFGEESWSISGDQIGTFMDFTSKDVNGVATLEPYVSAEKMAPFFATIADQVATDPVDAEIKTDGEKAWVEPAKPGTKLDPEGTAKAVTEAALLITGRTAAVAVIESEPEFTTEEAEALGIRDLLASYTTEPFAGTANRQNNVRITTRFASDVILAPGEIYDFDKQIGPRTAARGYRPAPGIVGPGRLEDVPGGGICQVSTTLFNAAFFAGLEIVERRNHSLYIAHYPRGRDATVAANGPNMRFRNDTSNHILIKGTSTGIVTTFNIYGTDDGRRVTYTTSDFYNVVARTTVTVTNPALGPGTTVVQIPGQNGRQCRVVRTVTFADGTTRKDTFISTYPMVPRIIEVPTTTTTSTTIPTTPPTTVPPPTGTTVPAGPTTTTPSTISF